MLSEAGSDMIIQCICTVLSQKHKWILPQDYVEDKVSSKVVKIIVGFHFSRQLDMV